MLAAQYYTITRRNTEMKKLIALAIAAAFSMTSMAGFAADKDAKKPAATKDAKKGSDDTHKSDKAKAKSKTKR